MNWEHPDVQAGFRKARGTRDQTANICWIIEKASEFQKNIYLCFFDYAKAFDCVDHNKLWEILQEMGIPDHLTCLQRNLYAGQEATDRGQMPRWLLVQLNPGPFLSKQNLLSGKDMVLVNHTSVWIWTQHSIVTICRAILRKILESIQGHQERPTMNKVHERVTHLRDQSCQICSCQWDIAGNLDRRPNGKGDKHRAEIGIPQHKQ